jgi:hypothetical protein
MVPLGIINGLAVDLDCLVFVFKEDEEIEEDDEDDENEEDKADEASDAALSEEEEGRGNAFLLLTNSSCRVRGLGLTR